MNKVGIFAAYWLKDWKADIPYYIRKVAGLGFDVLEVPAAQLLNLTRDDLEAIYDAAKDSSIELTYCIGFSKDKDLASENSQVRKNGIEFAIKNLKIIHQLGGKVFCGINYSDWPGLMNQVDFDKRPFLDRSIACIREIIKTAEEYGILYCIEVVNRYEHYLINTAAEGISYIEEVGSSNLKLLLDTFHMNIEEDRFDQAILSAGNRLGHFHVGEPNRKPPGEGRMPWQEIVQALRKIDYNGIIVMEPFVHKGGEIGRDIRVWRELYEEASEEIMDEKAASAQLHLRSLL